eukprot:symbB.v1.2.011643.t1/scaffold789.1/size230748/4
MALLLLQELHLNKLNRSVVVCNAAVSACEKGSQWSHVLHLMRTSSPTVQPFVPVKKVEGGMKLYNSLRS